nr:3-deoxy-D-manno-octulosonic acid transferase [uncultured Desulfobulbus sp.]
MLIFQMLYGVLSSLALLCALPLLPLLAAQRKYRARIVRRLGFGLKAQLAAVRKTSPSRPTLWIHALSVGEVTSALPLVRGLRHHFPQAELIFTATTRSGNEVAHSLLTALVDVILPAPLDLGPVVPYYLHCIRPDLFIQVETDFWPHWLFCLNQHNIPTMLVNGRISARSFQRYHRFPWLFRPMFAAFNLLAMQTEHDAAQMRQLGIAPYHVLILGNLKFDTRADASPSAPGSLVESLRNEYGFSLTEPLWVCGSTHPGEEEQLLSIYQELRREVPGIQLLLAPRNVARSRELVELMHKHHLPCRRRTTEKGARGPVLLLDTIGELAGCYTMADVAFVGGSLVNFGGHNPLEPAAAGVPVLVGPYTEDFSEITQGLIEAGGVFQGKMAAELHQQIVLLLMDQGKRQDMGARAAAWTENHRGVVDRHLTAIEHLLADRLSNPG